MVGIALFEAKQMQYLRNCVAGLTQFPEGNFHYSLSGPVLNFFQEHVILGNETQFWFVLWVGLYRCRSHGTTVILRSAQSRGELLQFRGEAQGVFRRKTLALQGK
jgi:hypothetical protein